MKKLTDKDKLKKLRAKYSQLKDDYEELHYIIDGVSTREANNGELMEQQEARIEELEAEIQRLYTEVIEPYKERERDRAFVNREDFEVRIFIPKYKVNYYLLSLGGRQFWVYPDGKWVESSLQLDFFENTNLYTETK